MPDDDKPGLLKRFFGGGIAGLAGTISPMQAYQMGMPQAAGMTQQQLAFLLQQPECQAQLQSQQLQNQSAQLQLNRAQQNAQSGPPITTKDKNGINWYQQPNGQWKPLTQSMMGGMFGQNNDLVDNLAKDVISGQAVASQFPGFGANSLKSRVMSRVAELNPKFNFKQSELDYKQAQSQASGVGSVQGRKGQEVGAMAGSMEDMLDQIKPLINRLPDSKIQIANSAFRRGLQAVDDPDANELLGYLTSLRGFYASVLHGGGAADLANIKESSDAINRGIGKKGFPGMEKFLRNEATSRVKRLRGKGFEEKNPLGSQTMKIGRFNVEVQ